MTISELIEKLTSVKAEHGDLGVMLSSDAEGNSFHLVTDLSCGEAWHSTWLDVGEFEDDDEESHTVTHVVLWPSSKEGP